MNDLLSMYIGAASQHALRMSFVPGQEAKNFDTEVTAFWSQLIQRDLPLFFLPLKLKQFLESLTTSPVDRAVLLPNPHHAPEPTSCNSAVKRTRLRTAVFVLL